MERTQLSALLAAIGADPALAAELRSARSPEAAALVAAARGYPVTPAELRAVLPWGGELSDAELQNAAGGTSGNLYCLSLGCPAPGNGV